MKKFDVDELCASIDDGMPYNDICKRSNIKTTEQFKRFLYDASLKKGEIINYEFPLKRTATEIKILNDGSIKIGRLFVEQAFKKMELDIKNVNLKINIDVKTSQLIINIA